LRITHHHPQKSQFTYEEKSFEWDPKYLAAISTVYTTIPQCAVFEINQRKTITTKRAAVIFHRMLPIIQDWDSSHANSFTSEFNKLRRDKEEWGWGQPESEGAYQALELCNYLGIKASSKFLLWMHSYTEEPIQVIIEELIADHQIFLSTNFEEGVRLCEYTLRRCYNPSNTPSYEIHCNLESFSLNEFLSTCFLSFPELPSSLPSTLLLVCHRPH